MKAPNNIAIEKGPIPEASSPAYTSPALLWPSIPDTYDDFEYDRGEAPIYPIVAKRHGFLLQRKNDEPGLGCKALWSAIRISDQILIMDTHFSRKGMIALRENIVLGKLVVRDLRVITAEKDGLDIFNDIKINLYKDGRLSSGAKIGLAVSERSAPPFIHDRFAVSNGELWHFGGTVSGEQKLTAVSRGWSAENHQFLRLFNETWNIIQGRGGVR